MLQPILGQDTMPATNLTTDAGAALGRVLFYDKRLSTNQTVACASCHLQAHGFSDPRRFSVGFNGGLTGRNSMGLSNARWYERKRFF
ncbi:MAG: cytochrome-c peroxidase, partial [Verrucomicrobia bacterium]|nr:cytochrome-c peroxidase [Verrucomicrobiota bacterium]